MAQHCDRTGTLHYGDTITARQAASLTREGYSWEVFAGSPGFVVCARSPAGEDYWVRPVNGSRRAVSSGGLSQFASLDTAASWLREHGQVETFTVYNY